MRYSALLLFLAAGLHCAEPAHDTIDDTSTTSIVLATAADSVAFRAYEAAGAESWHAAPIVRFDFGSKRGDEYRLRRKHLWNRKTGAYRLEQPIGEDSTLVVLYSTWTGEGQAYVNGEPVPESESADYVARADRSHVNDVYWLAMPMKLFDDGVIRTLAPDSADATTDVVQLSFQDVGYTPGDRYWVFVDRESGTVTKWTYLLQGRDTPSSLEWTGYESFETPHGKIMMSTEKVGRTASLMTHNISFPESLPADMFTDPAPKL